MTPPPKALLPHDPERLGEHLLLGRLGSDGRDTLYLAERADGTRVSVRALDPEDLAGPGARSAFESEAQASRQLLWLSFAVVVAIFFVLSSAFGSSRDGLLIMLNLPLALIGGVVGVYLASGVLSVASIVGFITLFGIATRNGIMLVSHIRHLQEHEGVSDFTTAVVRGAKERLVPILMTALAAGLALVPIALSAGQPGSEIQAPMATVILFGLLSSTALNMIVVPIVYARFGHTHVPGVFTESLPEDMYQFHAPEEINYEHKLDARKTLVNVGSLVTYPASTNGTRPQLSVSRSRASADPSTRASPPVAPRPGRRGPIFR